MQKTRLDQRLVQVGLVSSRSQGESSIKLANVTVNGAVVTKPGHMVSPDDSIQLISKEQYVSRAGLKLASVAMSLGLDFQNKVVLDVGSSTGGFTDYALRHGARKVIAVDVGTDQLHPSLRGDERIELHEKTDIRHFSVSENIDYIIIDVSFVSLREILPSLLKMSNSTTDIIAMVKPQFEAIQSGVKHKGVIKNDTMRRTILKDFENWVRQAYVVIDKSDSDVSGAKGNQERFYLLHKA